MLDLLQSSVCFQKKVHLQTSEKALYCTVIIAASSLVLTGLFEVQQCPRGKHCNFLHVFRNPNNEYREANRDIYLSPDWTSSSFAKSSERRERASHYDEYYGRSRRRRRSPSPGLSYKRNGESDRKSSSNHRVKKSHKHGMKSRERHSSRSRRRKRDHSLGPWSQSRRSRHSRSCSHSQSSSRSRSRSRSRGRRHSRSRKRSRNRSRNRNQKRNQSRSWSHSHSRSSSRSRSPGRRRSGSRDKTTQSPKSK